MWIHRKGKTTFWLKLVLAKRIRTNIKFILNKQLAHTFIILTITEVDIFR